MPPGFLGPGCRAGVLLPVGMWARRGATCPSYPQAGRRGRPRLAFARRAPSAATVAAQYGTDGAGCGSARLACKGMSQEVATPTLRPIMYDRTECWGVFERIKGRCRSQALSSICMPMRGLLSIRPTTRTTGTSRSMLRLVVSTARTVAIHNQWLAAHLRGRYPEAHIEVIRAGMDDPVSDDTGTARSVGSRPRSAFHRSCARWPA